MGRQDPGERDRLQDRVQKHSAKLAELMARPEVINLVNEIQELPEDQRMEAAKRLATREELERRGVPLPSGLRVTTRVFEDPRAPTLEATMVEGPEFDPLEEASGPTVCHSYGLGYCVSVGDTLPVTLEP